MFCSHPVLFYLLQVANLFAKDELDEITNELVPVMKKKQPKRPPTRDNLYDFFIASARNNLHIVLCFSPVSITILPNTLTLTYACPLPYVGLLCN